MKTQAGEFWKLFKASACLLHMKAATQEEIFKEIVGGLIKGKQLDPAHEKKALKALMEREETASTGIGNNVAVPHVKLSGLDEAVVSLATHSEGVDWRALDGEPAKIFFTVLRPARASDKFDPDRHLDMMRWIAHLGRIGDFRNFALAATTRTELVDLLKEMSERQD